MTTVRPEALRAVLNEKLAAASRAVADQAAFEAPELNRHQEPKRYISEFLHAARGVYPSAAAFGEYLGSGIFKVWYDSQWLPSLPDADRILWTHLRDWRVGEEHGEGPDLIQHKIEITHGHGVPQPATVLLLGLAQAGYEPKSWKGGLRFKTHPNDPASNICRECLVICRKFANDVMTHFNIP